MARLVKSLALLFALLTAQHGSVVHDLSHIAKAGGVGIEAGLRATDQSCALCPAFAQAGAAAFSHSFQSPLLSRAAAERTAFLPHARIGASALGPRSRGPPV